MDKPKTTAVWVDPAVAGPTAEELGPLTAHGELFVEFGRLEWSSGTPRVVEGERADLPPRTPVTLVVFGDWPRDFGALDEAGLALGEELQSVTLQGESRGWRIVGVHLEAFDVRDLEGFGKVLAASQEKLSPELFLSVSVPRYWLDQEALQGVADAVDFLVPELYGQRPGVEIWDPAWTLTRTVADARRVDALGRDFLVGVSSVGVAILDSKAGVSGVRTRGSLRELALSPALELVPGFSLSGIDGRRYSFRAQGAVRFGGEPLGIGEKLEVIGLGISNLQDFRAALVGAGLARYRGEVFYRLPAAEERFLLSRPQIVGVVQGDAPPASVAVAVVPGPRRGGRQQLTVSLQNTGQQATEIASIDHNYVELTAIDGYFSDADRGEFQRYQLLRRGGDGQAQATLRRANVLRLFRPILDLGDRVTSGTIQLTPTGSDPRLRLTAAFLLPDGEVLRMPVEEWRP